MKKKCVPVLSGFFLIACHASVSTDEKLDSLGAKIENKAAQVWDSTKAKAKEIKEKVEDKLDKADSVHVRVDTTHRKL